MEKSCSFCGSGRLGRGDIDKKQQIKHITQQLDSLEVLRTDNHTTRDLLGNSNLSAESNLIAIQKSKYIELLKKKENLLNRIHKMKNSQRLEKDKTSTSVPSSSSQSRRESIESKQYEIDVSVIMSTSLEEELGNIGKILSIHRMSSVLSIFKMMDVDVQQPERRVSRDGDKRGNETTPEDKSTELLVTGCSSILSVPIPNNGNYTGTPLDVVTSAVAHISHLVDALSVTLNIPLAHPLLPFEASDCMVSAQQDLWARAQVKDCCYSLSPASFINDRSRFREFDWTTLNELPVVPSDPLSALPAFDHQAVVNTASNGEVREYAVNSNFPAALVLLQANVVTLCLKAGLEAEALWPAEAMLLNLHLLRKLCEQTVVRNDAYLANQQDVPIVSADTESGAQQLRSLRVLRSLQDRYGSHAAVRNSEVSESIYLFEEGGSPVRADFTPERSGLARDGEWDLIHMNV